VTAAVGETEQAILLAARSAMVSGITAHWFSLIRIAHGLTKSKVPLFCNPTLQASRSIPSFFQHFHWKKQYLVKAEASKLD
jgi:hypothetical protein